MTSLERRLSLCRTDCQWRRLKQIPRSAFNQFDVKNSPEFTAPVLKEKKGCVTGKRKFFGVSRVAVGGDKRLGGDFDDLGRFGVGRGCTGGT